MNKNTYWAQAQENEDREQEAFLTEYRKRKEERKSSSRLRQVIRLIRRLFCKVD